MSKSVVIAMFAATCLAAHVCVSVVMYQNQEPSIGIILGLLFCLAWIAATRSRRRDHVVYIGVFVALLLPMTVSTMTFSASLNKRIFISNNYTTGTDGWMIRVPYLQHIDSIPDRIVSNPVTTTEELASGNHVVELHHRHWAVLHPDPEQVLAMSLSGKTGEEIIMALKQELNQRFSATQ